MAYVQVRRGKPSIYQAGPREWVCQGLGQVGTGSHMRGAYTNWKNLVAMAELCSMEADKLTHQRKRALGLLCQPFATLGRSFSQGSSNARATSG